MQMLQSYALAQCCISPEFTGWQVELYLPAVAWEAWLQGF